MNAVTHLSQRAARTGIAVFAAALLVSGAAWHGFAADSQSTAAHVAAATTTTPITHAIAGGRDSYADVVNIAAPAVVTVRVSGKAKVSPTGFQGDPGDQEDLLRRFFGDQFGQRQGPRGPQIPQRSPRQRGLGSGVMVTTDGYILTNNHVVDGADDIKVDLTDDRTLTAKLVGSDKASDLALLKVTGSDFKALPLGNSDNVQVGDVVLAVGNPMGIGQTVTMGIISAKGRSTGRRRRRLRGLPADRRADQPRQLRRRAREHEGRARRHQLADPVQLGRQHRHRLRDSGEHGEERHGAAAHEGQGHAGATRRHGPAGDVRHGAEPRAEARGRRDRQLGDARQRGGTRGREAGRRD